MHIKSVNVYDDTAQSLRDIRDEFENSTHNDEFFMGEKKTRTKTK